MGRDREQNKNESEAEILNRFEEIYGIDSRELAGCWADLTSRREKGENLLELVKELPDKSKDAFTIIGLFAYGKFIRGLAEEAEEEDNATPVFE